MSVNRYVKLADNPTRADLELVVTKLLQARWCARVQEWIPCASRPNPDLVGAVVVMA